MGVTMLSMLHLRVVRSSYYLFDWTSGQARDSSKADRQGKKCHSWISFEQNRLYACVRSVPTTHIVNPRSS